MSYSCIASVVYTCRCHIYREVIKCQYCRYQVSVRKLFENDHDLEKMFYYPAVLSYLQDWLLVAFQIVLKKDGNLLLFQRTTTVSFDYF